MYIEQTGYAFDGIPIALTWYWGYVVEHFIIVNEYDVSMLVCGEKFANRDELAGHERIRRSMNYERPEVPEQYPGLTKEETLEFQRLEVAAMMYGRHSLLDDRMIRWLDLKGKMDSVT